MPATGDLASGIAQLVDAVGPGALPLTIAAAGSTIGTATAIPLGVQTVTVTTTTSAEGVKLPEMLAFLQAGGTIIRVVPKATVGVKVYPTSGQGINAVATSGALVVASGKPCAFIPLGGGYGGSAALRWASQKGG